MTTLVKNYEINTNLLVDEFLKKHDIDAHDKIWIRNNVGGILDIIEYTIPFMDIYVDMKYNTPNGFYIKYMQETDEFYRTTEDYVPMLYEHYILENMK